MNHLRPEFNKLRIDFNLSHEAKLEHKFMRELLEALVRMAAKIDALQEHMEGYIGPMEE